MNGRRTVLVTLSTVCAAFGLVGWSAGQTENKTPAKHVRPNRWVQTRFPKAYRINGIVDTPSGMYVSTTADGVWRSTDARRDVWTDVTGNLSKKTGRITKAGDGTVVVADRAGVPWWLDASTGTWTHSRGFAGRGTAFTVFCHDRHGNIVLATTWNGITWHSTDNGRSFSIISNKPHVRVFGMSLAPDGTLLKGCEVGGVFVSVDDGHTWKQLPGTESDTKGGHWAGGNTRGVFKNAAGEYVASLSETRGITSWYAKNPKQWKDWTQSVDNSTPHEGYLQAMPWIVGPDGNLYGAWRAVWNYHKKPFDHVLYSSDGGHSWSAYGTGLPTGPGMTSYALEFGLDGRLYYGSRQNGLWRTTDRIPGDKTRRSASQPSPRKLPRMRNSPASSSSGGLAL